MINTVLEGSVVDPHHIDADSTYHPDSDPDPTFQPDRIRIHILASCQIKAQTLKKVLKYAIIPYW